MRKVTSFILGMLFGIIFLFASLGIAGYVAAEMVRPSSIWSNSEDLFGDFYDKSFGDIARELYNLYAEKALQPDENGNYYSIGDFENDYHVDFSAVFGIHLNDDTKKIPLLTLFSENGFQKVLDQTPINAAAGYLSFIGDEAKAKLSHYSMSDLIAGNFREIFSEITFAELLPETFASESGANAMFTALGGCYVGGAYDALTKGSVFAELLPSKALESLGQLKFTDLLGANSQLLSGVFGDSQLVDLIDQDGNVVPEQILNGVYVGSVLGYVHITRCYGDDGVLADCTDTSQGHVHDEDYWAVKNADGTTTEVAGINAILAKISYSDITSDSGIQGILDNILLGNVMYTLEEAEKTSDFTDILEDTAPDTVWQSGETIIKKYDGKYYLAKLKCKNAEETHAHTADCYGFIWYTEDSEGNKTEAEDLLASLGDIGLGKLTTGALDLMSVIGNLTLEDILGNTELDSALEAFATKTINELISGGFKDIYLGSITGFERYDVTSLSPTQSADRPDGIKEVTVNGETKLAKQEDGKYYIVRDCEENGAEHVHTLDCYKFIWYTLNCTADPAHSRHEFSCYSEAEGIIGKFASLTVKDITEGKIDGEIADLTMRDVLGEGVPSMLKSLADVPIGQMETKIHTLCLGDLLSYNRDAVNTDGYTAYADGIMTKQENGGISYAKSTDGENWYDAHLNCGQQHIHSAKCFTVWYKTDAADETAKIYADGIEAVFADKTINEITGGIDGIIDGLTLKDVLGDEVPSVLKSLADTPIGNLSNAVNALRIGDINYSRQETDVTGWTAVGAVAEVVTDGSDYARKDGEKWYAAQFDCAKNHAHTADCYKFIWKDDSGSVPDGIIAVLADIAVSDISNSEKIQNAVQSLTLRDVLGDSAVANGMLANLADTRIGDISGRIDNMYIGEIMNMYKKAMQTDGYTDFAAVTDTATGITYTVKSNGTNYIMSENGTDYFQAKLSCTDQAHTDSAHSADCFGYVWYTDEECITQSSGINSAVANIAVSELGGDKLMNSVNNLTLSDLGIEVGGNKLLEAVSDTPIKNVGTAINDLSMGTVLGFVKQGGVWLDVCTDGHDHAAAGETEINGSYYKAVTGINRSIADKKVSQLNGSLMTDLVNDLTVGELVESGMITLSADDYYKFDIIFCTDPSHTHSYTVAFTSQEFACNYANYVIVKNAGQVTSAEQYFKDAHQNVADYTATEERNAWYNVSFTQFISGLLSKI